MSKWDFKYFGYCFLVFVIACSSETSSEGDTNIANQLASQKTVKVKRKNLSFPISSSGRLDLKQEVFLSFKIGGTIQGLKAQKGDRVYRGQLLASLNKAEIQEQFKQAQENHNRLKDDLARTEALYKQQIGTLQRLEELRTAFKIAESNLNIATTSLNDANLYAPNSGIILDKFIEIGELASPGSPIYKISGQGAGYIFKAFVPDEQVVRVSLGDSSNIYFSAYSRQAVPGRVTHIATTPDPQSGLYTIEVSFSDNSLKLKPGFIGNAQIYAKENKSYAFIPPEALIEADKYDGLVYIRGKNGSLESQKIKIAYILNEEIAVSQGLEGIQEIIIP